MLIRKPRSWEIPERLATSEHVFFNRRQFLSAAGAGAATIALGACDPYANAVANIDPGPPDPTGDLYPLKRNEAFTEARPITPEFLNAKYNNFYEFGSHKSIAKLAQGLHIRPWEIVIDGLVEDERTISIDDLVRSMPLEERVYRHRCVEAWSMVIAWGGFPMARLVELAKPLSSAKYVRMETFENPAVARGQKASWYPWPYSEAVTIEEATNDLAFLVTGAYGKPLAKQHGSPLRLALPWKYGFKSIKSIVRFEFTAERPVSFWEDIQPQEYGFWANVNPEVRHARWSQATERDLETGERIPTRLFNGYAEEVGDLYKGLENERLYT